MRESILYATKYETRRVPGFWYTHFFASAFPTHLSDPDSPITKLRVCEYIPPHEGFTYFAWWDNEKQSFTYVHGNRAILGMVFPGGLQPEIDAGHGEPVEVSLEELGTFTKEEAENAEEKWRP